MENSPIIDDFPVKTSIYKGFSMAMLNNQMVPINVLIPLIFLRISHDSSHFRSEGAWAALVHWRFLRAGG
jgi:hypothetical protein